MAKLSCGTNVIQLPKSVADSLALDWQESPAETDPTSAILGVLQSARNALMQEIIASKCPAGCQGKVILTQDIGLAVKDTSYKVPDSQDPDHPAPEYWIRAYHISVAPVAAVLCTSAPLGRGAKLGTLDMTDPKSRGSKFGSQTSAGRGAKYGRAKPR